MVFMFAVISFWGLLLVFFLLSLSPQKEITANINTIPAIFLVT